MTLSGSIVFAAALLAGTSALAQTSPETPTQAQDASAASAATAPTGKIAMKSADGAELGTIILTQTKAGVILATDLKGLPEGAHGIHFHAVGKCEPPFESAGPHYNPTNAKHGFTADGGPHIGDMVNLRVAAGGTVQAEMLNPFVSLDRQSGNTLFDADGTALVIHATADDYATDPSGNSGARIACGVVE